MSAISNLALSEAGPLGPGKSGSSEAQNPTGVSTAAQSVVGHPFSAPIYSSPVIYVDPHIGQVVYEFRDSQSGKLQYSVPSSGQLQLYQSTQNSVGGSTTASAPASESNARPTGVKTGASGGSAELPSGSPAPTPVSDGAGSGSIVGGSAPSVSPQPVSVPAAAIPTAAAGGASISA
jgi:hypothetical protein